MFPVCPDFDTDWPASAALVKACGLLLVYCVLWYITRIKVAPSAKPCLGVLEGSGTTRARDRGTRYQSVKAWRAESIRASHETHAYLGYPVVSPSVMFIMARVGSSQKESYRDAQPGPPSQPGRTNPIWHLGADRVPCWTRAKLSVSVSVSVPLVSAATQLAGALRRGPGGHMGGGKVGCCAVTLEPTSWGSIKADRGNLPQYVLLHARRAI